MSLDMRKLTISADNGSFSFDVVDQEARDLAQQALNAAGSGGNVDLPVDVSGYDIKGVVSSPDPKIEYEVGYYIAQTNGHEVISFPSICMRNGDIVYYDGEYFNHIKSKGTFAVNKDRHYNVIIVGSGAAGMGTAINLIGSGMKVAVIEKNKHLGGTHTCAGITELCPSPVDDSLKEIVRTAWEDGYARFTTSNYTFGDGDTFEQYWNGSHLNWISDTSATMPSALGNKIALDKYWLQQYYYERLVSGGIDVYLDTEIVDAVSDGNYIRAVIDADGNVYNADFFVDASGVIIRKCGTQNTDYYYGYDGSARFGESKVGSVNPNTDILNLPTLGFEQFATPSVSNVGSIPKIHAPFEKSISGGMNKFESPRFGTAAKYSTASKWLEAHPTQNPSISGTNALCRTEQHIGLDNLGITPSELFTNGEAKTYAKYRTKALRQNRSGVSFDYAEVNEMLGIREGCRINALYMGTQTDCEHHVSVLGDRLILSSWYYELHGNGGSITKPYFRMISGLPITSMMSAKFKNYLNPSKDKGLSHYAHSTFRLTRTCWLSGRLSAEILKLVWQTTNDVSTVDMETVKANSGVDALFTQIRAYIPSELIPGEKCEHNYTSEVTTEATCTTQGVRTYTCSVCGDTYKEPIAANGHNYIEGSCSVCGATDPNYETEVTLSSISATYSGGDMIAGTSLNELTGIVVTATYSDGSATTVTEYTLHGEIAEGVNTITVTYEGMTTTFTVTGIVDDAVELAFEIGSLSRETGEEETRGNNDRLRTDYFSVSGTEIVVEGTLFPSVGGQFYAFRAYDADYQFLGWIAKDYNNMYTFKMNPVTETLPYGTAYLRMLVQDGNSTKTEESIMAMTGTLTINGVKYRAVVASN